MAMEKLGIKHKGLVLFGIILLVIGLAASFYYDTTNPLPSKWGYPFQTLGTVLVLVGIVLTVLGFFYSPQKPSTTSPPHE